ncbi:lysylphosphatidylglycerol synthase transmembrane domain-containing protein [Paenibacillus marchantiophytorum]|uniref:lysylphosphatidylglycerol synthase transmembrane domain-containing protein n=1 Tax=Paenibacillus marchantiophytorum TaxID=1619310 RepID=UPI00166F1E48|nr:lysylphosphatidylglycerol synthase transmembrane domain-containing protein [Paenibacillus marchantiophytorum]
MLKKKQMIRFIAILLVVCSIILTWRWFDSKEWLSDVELLFHQPNWLAFMLIVYLASFLFKTAAWRIYAGQEVKFAVYFHAISYSLLVNHILPIKVGDGVRTGIFMKYGGKSWEEAVHSVAVMRLLDMLILAGIGGIGIVRMGLPSSWIWVTLLACSTVMLATAHYLPVIRKFPFVVKHSAYFQLKMLSGKGLVILGLITLSWVLEAGVIFAVVQMIGLQLGSMALVWANSMTIAGQIFHITPGGIGTYESTMSGSLALLGIDGKDAYRAALLSHTFKFLFAYSLGGYSLLRMPLHWREMKTWIRRVTGQTKSRSHSKVRKED